MTGRLWLVEGATAPAGAVASASTDAGTTLAVVDGKRPPGGLAIDPAFVDPAGTGAQVSLCWAPDHLDLPFDDPSVPAAIRAVLAAEPPAACSTLARDAVHLGGAITAWRGSMGEDPFARLLPRRVLVVGPGLIASGWRPPCGPATQRYAGVPWPGGRFA